MGATTAELTTGYIKEHPDIKSCLKKGLINYSSLSRLIAKDLGIGKGTSKEAILIAARRFREKLEREVSYEKKIALILKNSEIEIKNKMAVFILEKNINLEYIDEIQKIVRKESGTSYVLEGSDNYTLITQEKYAGLIEKKFSSRVIKSSSDLVILNFKSPKEIENTIGVMSYLTSLFTENNINIKELISCWTDTLFVIGSNDLNRVINLLRF